MWIGSCPNAKAVNYRVIPKCEPLYLYQTWSLLNRLIHKYKSTRRWHISTITTTKATNTIIIGTNMWKIHHPNTQFLYNIIQCPRRTLLGVFLDRRLYMSAHNLVCICMWLNKLCVFAQYWFIGVDDEGSSNNTLKSNNAKCTFSLIYIYRSF